MNKRTLYLRVIVGCLLLAASVWAKEKNSRAGFMEQVTNGSVNWATGVVSATGMGEPVAKGKKKASARQIALSSARSAAARNLLEILKNMRVTSSMTVRNLFAENDVVMAKVEGMIRNAKNVKKEYLTDGTVKLTLQMSLYGGFSQLVLPSGIRQIIQIKPLNQSAASQRQKRVEKKGGTIQQKSFSKAVSGSQVYTGLIIDLRGLDIKPAMSPRIFDENGQEVYGPAFASREFAVQQGICKYVTALDTARKDKRVSPNPITIKGIKTHATGQTDVVISNADAAKIRSASEHLSFLRQCRVIVVMAKQNFNPKEAQK